MNHESLRMFIGMAVFSIGIFLLRPAAAQQPAVTGQQAAASAADDRAQMENFIRVIKLELKRSEERAGAIRTNMIAINESIESRIDQIVSLLSSVRDSAESSGSRMRKTKEEVLAGLKATSLYYAQERDKRKNEMLNPLAKIDGEELARNVAALNAQIESRVTQSLEIAKSLAQHDEAPVERYRNLDTFETQEHIKSKNDARASVKIKADLVETLRASISKLTRDIASRETELRSTANPQKKEMLSKDIETMRQTIAARQSQMAELLSAPKPSTRAVSSKAAFEMEKLIDEMRVELKRDFEKFRSLVVEHDMAHARLKPLREKLQKAEAMLEKMDSSPAPTAGN